jgi:large subunit ribosomal protein L22
MAVKAVAKGVRLSPRKVAVVAALVRGRTVEDALTILEHTPRRSAVAVSKVIKSAKANADHNHNYKPATLQITEISVTPGPRLKRYRPAAHGRALPFQRKTAHIRVIVDGEQREAKPAKKTEAAKPATAKTEAKPAAKTEEEKK